MNQFMAFMDVCAVNLAPDLRLVYQVLSSIDSICAWTHACSKTLSESVRAILDSP